MMIFLLRIGEDEDEKLVTHVVPTTTLIVVERLNRFVNVLHNVSIVPVNISACRVQWIYNAFDKWREF